MSQPTGQEPLRPLDAVRASITRTADAAAAITQAAQDAAVKATDAHAAAQSATQETDGGSS